jgi:hypothetical protein
MQAWGDATALYESIPKLPEQHPLNPQQGLHGVPLHVLLQSTIYIYKHNHQ